MRTTEQRLWDRFRSSLGSKIRLERVENMVTVGMPDVISLVESSVCWVELKAVVDYPARATTPVLGDKKGLSREQRNWHHDWWRWGGVSFVLIGVGSHDLYLIRGKFADQINKMNQQSLIDFAVARDWAEVYEALK